MRYKVFVATELTAFSLSLLEQSEDIEWVVSAPKTRAVLQHITDAHAIIARDDVELPQDTLELAPALKVIGRVGTGITGIDVDYATRRGIIVTHTPDSTAVPAAELTLLHMLALCRRLPTVHHAVQDGWWLFDRQQQVGSQLHRKTVGLIGLGRVGKQVAQRCLAFGMTVLAYDPYLSPESLADLRVTMVSLEELLARSDFISLHVPATSGTQHLLNAERIAKIKQGARVINTSAGTVWDEHALADALKQGKLAGVGVDVYTQEPPYNSPLIGLANVVHTPHIGDNTLEANQDISVQIVQQVLDALHGVDYRNVVNMPLMGFNYEDTKPYLHLGEQIGRLQYALHHAVSPTRIQQVGIECRGEEMSDMIKPLMVAMLKGLLEPVMSQPVSYVNAPILAEERGLQVTQKKGLSHSAFNNVVSCQIICDDGKELVISGTLLDQREPYITRIDDYILNFVPQTHMLILGSYDQPGVIGRVGTLMANEGLNIASWYTGRVKPGGNTLTILSLDEPISDPILDLLTAQEFIRHATRVEL